MGRARALIWSEMMRTTLIGLGDCGFRIADCGLSAAAVAASVRVARLERAVTGRSEFIKRKKEEGKRKKEEGRRKKEEVAAGGGVGAASPQKREMGFGVGGVWVEWWSGGVVEWWSVVECGD